MSQVSGPRTTGRTARRSGRPRPGGERAGQAAWPFAYPHADIAAMLGRTAASCRQLIRRARQRIEAERPRTDADRVARFLTFVIGRVADGGRVEPVRLNGGPAALVTSSAGELIGAVFVEPGADGNAAEIRWVRNPSKLSALR